MRIAAIGIGPRCAPSIRMSLGGLALSIMRAAF